MREISDDDLEVAIVDGRDDLDCDLIHRDDKQVLIVQARYRGHGAKEPPEKISHFQSILKRLADPDVKANARLRDQLSTIDWKNDSFDLVYVTFGNIDNQARRLSEQKANYLKAFQISSKGVRGPILMKQSSIKSSEAPWR